MKHNILKKFTSLALTLTLLLSLIPMATLTATAASDTWDGTVAASFAGGDGLSEATAYQIATAEQLAYMANRVNTDNANYRNKHYELTSNIDLAGHQWTPIGDAGDLGGTCFKGSFDGKGHTISNLAIGMAGSPEATFANSGLFGYVYCGTITGIGVLNVGIYSSAGHAGGLAGTLNGTGGTSTPITNCYTTGSITVGGVAYDAGYCAGGLVGISDYSNVSNCFSVCSVTGGENTCAGGLVGYSKPTGSIISCYATGNVTSSTGEYAYAGGLIGFMEETPQVANCYATGNTSTQASTYAGGLIGYRDNGGLAGCYCNSSATRISAGTPAVAKGVGEGADDGTAAQTSTQMKDAAFVTSLNTGCPGVWAADTGGGNQGYPMLTAVTPPPSTSAPTVTGISPTSGPTAGGTSVTITGTDFTGATAVTIGATAATDVTIVNDTTITAKTPAGTAGARDVSVTTPGGTGTGTGLFIYTAPEIDVQGSGIPIASGDAAPSSSDGTNFGSVGVSGGSVQKTFTILNTGMEALTLSESPLVSISGTSASDFNVTAPPATPVAASGSTSFTITFDPSAAGIRTATVTIASNDSNEGTYTFAIQGTGLSSDAALSGGTVKGQTVTLGTPNSALSSAVAGSVPLTEAQAADTTGGGGFVTSFSKSDASATVKVVKYPSGTTDFSGFDGDSAYADGAVSNGDIFAVRVTAVDATVSYYKIAVTVAQAPVLSKNTGLTVGEGADAAITNTMLSTTDSDTAAASITYTIDTAPPYGTLKKSAFTLSVGGTFTQDDIDNSRVTYTHDGGETSSDFLLFTVSDGTNTLSAQTFAITVIPVNDAPVISAPASICVTEDVAAALTGISFADADAGSGAMTATFSVSSGALSASWGGGVTVGGTDSALTLTGTCADINAFIAGGSLFYTPASNDSGSLTLAVTLNDNGYAGAGGAGTDLAYVTLNITSVNDAPTLSGGPYVWTGTNEDTTGSSIAVSSILSGMTGQDADGNFLGIVLTATTGNGTWQYSTDGSTWTGVGTVSAGGALLLSPATQLRYVPDGKNGESLTLTFRAWDQTSGTASTNSTRNTADTTTSGGSTAFSTGTAQANLTVSSVNDAPTLMTAAPSFTSLTASQTGNDGEMVASLAGGPISDVDTGALEGIALVATVDGGGAWQFSTNNGGIWTDVGAVSEASALLLRNTDLVRFVPGGPDPTTARITYRAWDRTAGSQGNKVSITASGGTTAFSTGTDTADIRVNADASVIAVASTAANGTYKAGDSIVITVKFDNAVTVTGTPQLTLAIGATNRTIYYLSGSESDTLLFTYTVHAGDTSSDLDYAAANALSVSGGAIQTGGANASLILPAPGAAGSLGASTNIVIDGVAPTVTITVVDTALKIGDTSVVYVHFSEAVTGLTSADLIVANGILSSISSVDGGRTWAATFIPSTAVEDASNIITLDNTGVQDAAGNTGIGTTDSNNYSIDTRRPAVTSVAVPSNGSYMAGANLAFVVTFNESVTVTGTPHISLNIGGTIVYANYSAGSGSMNLTFTYPIGAGLTDTDGISLGTLSLNGGTINDAAENAATLALNHVGATASVLVDTTSPVSGGAGTITTSELTSGSVKLTWTAATDNMTTAANLQYKVVYSLSNNISTLTDAETKGTAFGNWAANVTSTTVTGLSAGTGYYFNIIVKDAAGNKAAYTSVTATTAGTPAQGGGGSSSTPAMPPNAVIEVNGQRQNAGTASTQTTAGTTVTTITVDDNKLNNILAQKDNKATVTLPVNTASDVVVGELTGQTVKNMETKEATLEIKTSTVTYTLPASQINIDAISSQLGPQVELKDIKVSVKIAEPPADTVKVVESAANKGGYQIVVKPVDFEITCTSGGKTVEVSKFNGYVARTIAIPDSVDPSKITTGIVLNADGTFRHVPTEIIVANGKYYAKINSLTNSTYSVIWNPVEFSDVTNHWAKASINNMGSRMVVAGIGGNHYDPDRNMTRAEFAAIMVRALGLEPGTGASGFSGVSSTEWYCGYIETAALYGIIKGYSDGTFGPDDYITREQAMTMIARAMKLTGLKAKLAGDEAGKLLEAYTDRQAVSDYAKDSVAACLKTGVVSGRDNHALAPKSYITRAEVAVMAGRLLQASELI